CGESSYETRGFERVFFIVVVVGGCGGGGGGVVLFVVLVECGEREI
ncbi:hypothetical protein A2U01_0088834, partial [Trifolium medium]|nr:hypothetical protein [Trifolium medium]